MRAVFFLGLLFFICSSDTFAQQAASNKQDKDWQIDHTPIRIKQIDERFWLVDSQGQPFFAHGITHSGIAKSREIDFAEYSVACRRMGFNSYGYGCPPELRNDMPYIESWNHLVPISTYRGDGTLKFVDIFDPAVQTKIRQGVTWYCKRSRNNPNLIGYCWTDLGAWPLENTTGKNWVDYIRSLPEDSPGRKRWIEFLATWDGLDETERDQAFLKIIAREYFRLVGETTKKHDPEHLIFGDRFAFNTLDKDVLAELLPWVDAIAIQPPFREGFPQAKLNEIHEATGKPILICDFAIRFKDGDKDIRSWKPMADSNAAGIAYKDYLKAALDSKFVIGVFWCNPVDTPKGFDKLGIKQGFFGDGLAERIGLHESVQEINQIREQMTPKENVSD